VNLLGEDQWRLRSFKGVPDFYTSTPPSWFFRLMGRWLLGFHWERIK
jgi:hypothetical protein